MQSVLNLEAIVLPGHRLEVSTPDLPEGTRVRVIVLAPPDPALAHRSALDFLNSLPAGPRACATWEEYETSLEEERNSWDR